MPYLHWERQKEVVYLKDTIRFLQEHPENTEPNKDWDDSQKLAWAYVKGDKLHPIHIRRTLDQYHYHVFDDTDIRDDDQTALRYSTDLILKGEKCEPVLTMVDQLWMWILPSCEPLPPTIITAFPERSNRQTAAATALVRRIIDTCGNRLIRSCYDVARVIASECSKIYLDRSISQQRAIQFHEVYNTSITAIVRRLLPSPLGSADTSIIRWKGMRKASDNFKSRFGGTTSRPVATEHMTRHRSGPAKGSTEALRIRQNLQVALGKRTSITGKRS